MVSVIALCSTVALLVGLSVASDEAGSSPQGPGGVARRFEQMEQTCFQEAQLTAEEIQTVVSVRQRATQEVGSQNVNRRVDFLEYVDRYAPSTEISQGIRSKWNAFTVCVGREAAKLVPKP
uniref:Putative secreted salivary gland peptide ixodes scapularis secreted salivary gland peptide n=1 Tax=Amblyomma cajennense TaxID=34607 RepID=A0A023FPX7_AMBCJ